MPGPLAAIASAIVGCGAATPGAPVATTSAEERTSERVEVQAVAFSVVLPGGVVLSMDESGRILRDGLLIAALQADGRLLDARGRSIATLLPDGQLAHRGELRRARIHEAMPSLLSGGRETVLRDGATDLVTLAGARLRIAEREGWPSGELEVALPPDASDAARVAVVLAVTLEALERGAR